MTKPKDELKGTPADPTDHSTGGKASEERAKEADEAKEKADEDNSIVGKIRRSGLHLIRDHSTGQDYVGISPQNDPKASEASKRLSTVAALDGVAPQTGMKVVLEDGSSFTVPDGYGPDAKPEMWAAIVKPDGKALFA